MKRWHCILLVVFLMSLNVFATAPEKATYDRNLSLGINERTITSDGMRLLLDVAAPDWKPAGNGETPLTIAQFSPMDGLMEMEGFPVVPVISRMFRIPPNSGVVVEVIDAEYETYTDVEYAAYFGGQTIEEYGQVQNNEDSWYPGTLAEVTDPAIFHDFRFCNLVTYPVQVNTALGEVRVYSNIEVDIRFEGSDDRATLDEWPTAISEAFLPWYRHFLDWDENELDEYVLYRGGVQVVMRDNASLMEEFEDWFEWKLQKGWEIELLTDSDIVSWNAVSIRNELRDRYEEEKFDYIVIIGDAGGSWSVPVGINNVGGGNIGDYYYCLMDDDDYYQDVVIGRISVENIAQAALYVSKVLNYEKEPYMDETDWYLRGAGLAVTHYAGVSTVATAEYARSLMLNIGYTEVNVEYSVSAEPARGNVITHLNEGVSYYHSRIGVSDGLQNNHINALTNDHMLFVAMDLTCGTGDWSTGTTISETYMRAGSVNTPKAAIGAFGLATYSTNTAINNCLTLGGAHSALLLRLPELGQMVFGGQWAVYNSFGPYDLTKFREFCEKYNLMGDPLVWLWTAIPAEITVEASESITIGDNSYSVIVTDENEEPVEGAWVTFYKVDNDEEIVARAVTGPDGVVTLHTPVRFEGDAMLTVTRQNCIPVQVEVDVESSATRLGYVEATYQDNNLGGTLGNDNGVPEAGETVGIHLNVRNFGDAAQSNIVITAECDDPWIDDVSGEVTFNALGSGNQGIGDGMILVGIADEAKHDWLAHLTLQFESDQATCTDDYALLLNAPKYALVEIEGNDDWEPGETVEIDITLINIGGSDAALSEGYLSILHSYGNAVDPTADFLPMNIGQERTASFLVASHPESFPGFQTTAELVVTTEDGMVDTVIFSLMQGERDVDDPTGPDQYGYFAFDNQDEDYALCPDYDWVEINPLAPDNDYDGTDTQIYDGGDDQDECIVIELPFEVQYYGEVYDSVTINSNGFAAFGTQTRWWSSCKNWPIPAPGAPPNLLGVYWDERWMNNQSKILYYYDDPNDRFIIEWYRVNASGNSSPCTFEIIIYDLVGDHNTWTADNEILFQYGDLTHNYGTYKDVHWWTTGISNRYHDDGLQYYYWQDPSPGAVPLVDFDEGLSILWTTNVALIVGALDGTFVDDQTGDPVAGVSVRTTNNMYSATLGLDGYFIMEDVVIGDHTLICNVECYNDTIVGMFHVVEEETTTVNIGMRHPEIALDLEHVLVEDLDPEDEITVPLTISNPGTGVMNYSAKLSFDPPVGGEGLGGIPAGGGELDEFYVPWELTSGFDLDTQESRYRGLVFIEDYFLVSGSFNYDADGPNKLYKYNHYGELLEVFDQPVETHSNAGFYGMAWDGEYLYGADDGPEDYVLYQMEIGPGGFNVVNTIPLPVNPARYVAYEPGRDLFWVGDQGSEIRAVDREGNLVEEFGQDFFPRGLSWYENDPDGYNLYCICHASGESISSFKKMNPLTGEVIHLHTFEDLSSGGPSGGNVTMGWNPYAWTYVSVIDDGGNDKIRIFGFDDAVEYMEIVNPEGTLGPDSSRVIDLVFRGSNLLGREYSLYLSFDNDACDTDNNWVPVTMIITTGKGEDDQAAAQPLEWSFDGAYPNPFNPTTTIQFTLKEYSHVTARVFNLLGREVTELAGFRMSPGHHNLTFDGTGLASGMYFLRFEAGPIREMKKLILMK